jgi:cell cycle arrest protein BUB2
LDHEQQDAMQDPLADSSDRSAFLKILNQAANLASSSDVSDNLKRLRRLVLTRGIPDDTTAGEGDNYGQIRARVWKLLLRVDRVSPNDYLRWVDMGPSEVSAKSESFSCLQFIVVADCPILSVKNDTFRTLATDLNFKGKVREDMLIRLLEAFAWKNSQNEMKSQPSGLPNNAYHQKPERGQLEFAYVQGMWPSPPLHKT